MKKKTINIGDFAFCQKGEFGLILWEHKIIIKRTKKESVLYSGINLTPGKRWGLNWQSQKPKKATKSDLKKIMNGKMIYHENYE